MRTSASFVSAAVVLLALSGVARAGSSPYTGPGADTTGNGLYSCVGMINVMGQGPVKNYFYLTDPFPVPKAETQQLEKQWRDYVQSQHPGQLVSLASCSEAQSDPARQEANTQGWIDKYKSQATITRTTWKYGPAASAATTTIVQQQPGGGRFEGNPDAGGYFCTFDDQSAYNARTGQGVIVRYLSRPFSSTNNLARLGNDWSNYIRTTYHEPGTLNGSCMLNQGRYEGTRKDSEASKTMKVVLVNWLPGQSQGSAGAPAPAPAPSAAPSVNQNTQPVPRPASATQSPNPSQAAQPQTSQSSQPLQSAQPSPTAAASSADSGQKYAFCFDSGHPPHGPSEPARSIYYLSGVFPVESTGIPATAFQNMLSAAHPQERIDAATCTTPQPLETARAVRASEISARQKNPYITIAEVNWEP